MRTPRRPRLVLLAVVGAATGCGGGAGAPADGVCASPPPPAVVLSPQERRAPAPAVAADGTAVVAWETVTGDPVEAAVRRDGRWSAAVPVSERFAARPRTAVMRDGTAVVVWDGHDAAGRRAARVAAAVPGGAWWEAPRDLGGDVGDRSPAPEVVALPGGGALAAWAGTRGTGPMVADVAPSRLGAPTDLRRARGRVFEVGVGAGRDGAVVVWLDGRDGARVVRAVVRGAGGRWGPDRALSPEGGRANDPRVAVASDGTAVVAWRRDTGPGRQVVEAATRMPGGDWRTALVGPDAPRPRGLDRPPGPYPLGPRVAAATGGRAAVAWMTRTAGRDRVLTAVSTGGRWSDPAPVTGSDESGAPDVAFDPRGQPVLVWEDLDGVRLSVRMAVPGRPARVLSAAGQEVAAPRLLTGSGGDTVVWNATNRGGIVVVRAVPCA